LNHISVNETTLTLAISNHPRDLLKHLRSDKALTVDKQVNGIYYVHGERFPVQIIVGKALSEEDNLWLHSLRRGLTVPQVIRLVNESQRFGDAVRAYIFASSEANKKSYIGAREMEIVEAMLKDDFFLTHAKTRGFGFFSEANRETAQRMLLDGVPREQISKWIQLPIEKVLEIEQTLQQNEILPV
jgi:hypothetical protein